MSIELLQGDCLELMKDIPDKSIDLTVTSPPYDNLRSYNGNNDKWNASAWESVIADLFRITKDGGVVVWIIADATVKGSETGTSFRQAIHAMDVGFNLHDTMIWSKDTSPFPSNGRYIQTFEYMFIFSKGKPKTYNPIKDRKNKWAGTSLHGTDREKDGTTKPLGPTRMGKVIPEYGTRFNVWSMPGEKKNKTGHPAPFPVRLATDHIKSWSNPGDIVLDPFMGSGTTAIACHDLNRNFIGFELDPEYFEIAKQRISGERNKPKQITLW